MATLNRIEVEIPKGLSAEDVAPLAKRRLSDASFESNFDVIQEVEGNRLILTSKFKEN